MRIADKRILVTGGTTGIGWALARALLEHGARVFLCGRDPARLDRALERLPGALGAVCDIGHAGGLPALLENAVCELGGLDLLVNNAGLQQSLDFTEGAETFSETYAEPEAFERLRREISVNFTGPAQLIYLALPHLLRGEEPAVVNTTSILARSPKANAPIYCATKAALHSLTCSLRYQLAPRGIRMIELVPPLVDTEMTRGRDEGKKLSPSQVARAAVAGLEADRDRILIGRARQAEWLGRLAPGLLARKMMRA
ncbi:MAG: SDR family NAD(P)-dependent oxidoreductase [bacterium]|nr:SDR family NAD(P)-dependent oxidoreductase [bacterium]